MDTFTRQVRFDLSKYSPSLDGSFILFNTKGSIEESGFNLKIEELKVDSAELKAKYLQDRTKNNREAYFNKQREVGEFIAEYIDGCCVGGEIKGRDNTKPTKQDFLQMDNELLSDIVAVIFNGLDPK